MCPLETAIFCPNIGHGIEASIVWNFTKNSSIPCLWTRVPMGTTFSFWVQKGSPFSLIQAHKRVKCQSSHYLMSAILLLVIKYSCLRISCQFAVCHWKWVLCINLLPHSVTNIFCHLHFTNLVCFDQLSKIALGSPFLLAKVPIRSSFWNIARGTTDPGYRVYNFNYLVDWIEFVFIQAAGMTQVLDSIPWLCLWQCFTIFLEVAAKIKHLKYFQYDIFRIISKGILKVLQLHR